MKCITKNPGPLLRKGIRAIIECSPEPNIYNDLGDLAYIIVQVSKWIEDNLDLRIREVYFSENEPIDDHYIIYKYHLETIDDNYISCRLVTHDKKILSIICTLGRNLPREPSMSNMEEPLIEHNVPRGIRRGIPPGQRIIPYFIVYRILGQPSIELEKWKLKVKGLVEREVEFSYNDLLRMPRREIVFDFHCVTGWSVRGTRWSGIPLKHIASIVGVRENARWVYVEGLDGYTTIIPIEDFLHEDSILALKLNDKTLSVEQGFPARIIIPHLYGWKSIKWVTTITFTNKYIEGYWEKLGYHPRGNVWLEERFRSSYLF